ncbi:MAG: amidohydrolase family protein [Firmicutes bacterium]|nr:amidohydrolase family protein [Bacillota bacterium]
MRDFDIIVSGGQVLDGTGAAGFPGWVGVRGDRIAAVGALPVPEGVRAGRVLDAAGLAISPGFIDIHSHGDETLLLYPEAPSAVRQGITTFVGGNCGFSPAPLGDQWVLSFWEFDWWHEVAPYKYYEPTMRPLEAVRRKAAEKHGLDIDWRSFGEFLARVEAARPVVNYVPLVGHNALRTMVMGTDYSRPARPEEISAMRDLLRQALEEGARGMSTGLDYEPGGYAETSEIVELARVLPEFGGIYATHWRRTGIRKGTPQPALAQGLKEAVEIGRQAGVRVQVSHLLPAYRIFPDPPASLLRAAAEATLEILDEGLRRGVDVSFDVIPNVDGGVVIAPYLVSLLAPWLRDAGSPERLAELLAAPDYQAEIREYIEAGKWYSLNPKADPRWAEAIVILQCEDASLEGKSLAAIARETASDPRDGARDPGAGARETAGRGPAGRVADPLATLFDLVRRYPRLRARMGMLGREEALGVFFSHPRSMACSDTFIFDDRWEVRHPPYFLPHPNTYGVFPRYLRRYAGPSLEEGIARITSRPARALGFDDRGVIREGAFADLVVFDPASVDEGGDYLEPRRYPKGIRWVLVNGQVVVEDGLQHDARPGRVLGRGT